MSIGQTLREARERQNLTPKDVENQINIRVLYIQALENEEYQVIPGEVYLKGFLKTYANFLGLDGIAMVEEYKRTMEPEQPVEAELEKPQQVTRKVKKKKVNVRNVVVLLVGLAIVVGITAYTLQRQEDTPQQQPIQPGQQQATPVKPQPIPSANKPVPVAPQVVRVTAKYKERSWTKVTADGKAIYEGIPEAGQALQWEAKSRLSIKLGNAGAVDVFYNDQPQQPLGKSGEVVEKVYILP